MARTRRPLVGWGIGLLIGGVVLALISVVGGYRAIADDVRFFLAGSVSSPGTVTLHLTPGQYEVMEKVGDTASAGSLSTTTLGPTRITPNDVTVSNEAGGTLSVEASTTPFDFTRGTSRYQTAVQFQVFDEGNYAITVATPQSRFLVTPEVGSVVRHAAPWMLLLTLSGVAVVVGLVLLIVGLVRGRRTAVAAAAGPSGVPLTSAPMPAAAPAVTTPVAAAPSVAAAGWYADPGGSGRWRWWDGQRWTDHLS
jgi:hypothetical protein